MVRSGIIGLKYLFELWLLLFAYVVVAFDIYLAFVSCYFLLIILASRLFAMPNYCTVCSDKKTKKHYDGLLYIANHQN